MLWTWTSSVERLSCVRVIEHAFIGRWSRAAHFQQASMVLTYNYIFSVDPKEKNKKYSTRDYSSQIYQSIAKFNDSIRGHTSVCHMQIARIKLTHCQLGICPSLQQYCRSGLPLWSFGTGSGTTGPLLTLLWYIGQAPRGKCSFWLKESYCLDHCRDTVVCGSYSSTYFSELLMGWCKGTWTYDHFAMTWR